MKTIAEIFRNKETDLREKYAVENINDDILQKLKEHLKWKVIKEWEKIEFMLWLTKVSIQILDNDVIITNYRTKTEVKLSKYIENLRTNRIFFTENKMWINQIIKKKTEVSQVKDNSIDLLNMFDEFTWYIWYDKLLELINTGEIKESNKNTK